MPWTWQDEDQETLQQMNRRWRHEERELERLWDAAATWLLDHPDVELPSELPDEDLAVWVQRLAHRECWQGLRGRA